jgi:hypothetical protein
MIEKYNLIKIFNIKTWKCDTCDQINLIKIEKLCSKCLEPDKWKKKPKKY